MAYEISIEKTNNSRIHTVDFDNIPFGKVFSDHMFIANYSNGEWHQPRIVPFGNISIHPATQALHYGQAIFEGMKAYNNSSTGQPQIFRPEKNIQRLNKSAIRLAMPTFPEELFLEGLKELIKLDKDWIPKNVGSSLYIRPFMFAADEYIGVRSSESYTFIIFTGPVASYYSHPVKVKVADKYVRAFPGGTGAAKAAGNYAATLMPANEVKKEGYDQVLWTDAYELKYLQEIGTMNVFVVIDGTVITPPIDEGTILEGITRDSIITLMREKGYEVQERRISIDEVVEAYENGTLQDAFGSGTAATISHISEIGYGDKKMILPPVEEREISNFAKNTLNAVKIGQAADTHQWMYPVVEPVNV